MTGIYLHTFKVDFYVDFDGTLVGQYAIVPCIRHGLERGVPFPLELSNLAMKLNSCSPFSQ